MEIKTISYKRTRSLEPYNNESLEMHAELDYGEDPIIAAQELKNTVLIALGLLEPTPKPTQSEESKFIEANKTPDDNSDLDDRPF